MQNLSIGKILHGVTFPGTKERSVKMRIGVLGGGQLGRMLALAGYPLGLHFRMFDPHPGSPAGHLAELLTGEYDDVDALAWFADGCDVITYEFENVPREAAEYLTRYAPVYPPPMALYTAQDRLREKETFLRLGIPTPVFDSVDSRVELNNAVERFGLPGVLKTRRFGYDGKGQHVLRTEDDVAAAWAAMEGAALIFEGFVPFTRELSLVAVRGRDGATAFYPLVENLHRDGILRRTLAPAPDLTPDLQAEAEDHLARLMDALDYVGVLTVEFFEHEERLIANEMAPRVHNSGHWTIDGAVTSQFENHLRALCEFPLGPTEARGNVAMLNLIGTAPDPETVLAIPDAHLHLYGKSPRPGRKLGHITVVAPDATLLQARLIAVQSVL
jgi:5-(carboxyamino)imidazole ribonucleotide synthase